MPRRHVPEPRFRLEVPRSDEYLRPVKRTTSRSKTSQTATRPSASTSLPFRLAWLEINRFRSVMPGTKLSFSPSRNVILGQNASGKTSLLNLISMVLRSDFTEILEEPFELHYEILFPEGNLRAHVLNELSTTSAPPADQTGIAAQTRNQYQTQYSFTVTVPPETFLLTGTRASATLQVNQADPQQIPPIDLGTTGHGPFIAILRSTHKKSGGPRGPLSFLRVGTYRFDESLSAFHAMMGVSNSPVPGGPPTASLKMLRWTSTQGLPNGSISFTVRYIPPNVLFSVLSLKKELVLGDSVLPFLAKAKTMFGFKNATWRADVLETKKVPQGEETEYGRFAVEFIRGDDSRITHDLLSYGQKRLLAFLYYVDFVYDGPVVADEIVNGFHHSWIEACLDHLRTQRKQAFLTSQNPLLLDYLTFDSAEEVQATFMLCRSEVVDSCTVVRWAQMEKDEAATFYEEYQLGIEHVGAILHRSGLW
jgi:energy-coupling factor transporter ATP-binding protein EcfA2